MADGMREIEESSVSLGDIVAALSKARDMAQAGERIKMRDAFARAKRELSAISSDCEVICEIRENERQDDEENSQCGR